MAAGFDKIAEKIGELNSWNFSMTLSVPDGATSRPPTLGEITALELSVGLVVDEATFTYLMAWTFSAGTWTPGAEQLKNVDIKDVGRGAYDESTGLLTVVLHAGDNPCAAVGTAPGLEELHEAIITARYNVNVDQLVKRVRFTVVNLNKVPREP